MKRIIPQKPWAGSQSTSGYFNIRYCKVQNKDHYCGQEGRYIGPSRRQSCLDVCFKMHKAKADRGGRRKRSVCNYSYVVTSQLSAVEGTTGQKTNSAIDELSIGIKFALRMFHPATAERILFPFSCGTLTRLSYFESQSKSQLEFVTNHT